MKKKLFLAMSLAMGLFVATSCSDDDNDGGNGGNPTINSNYDLAYSAENATAWGNYMVRVAELLRDDAATLYADWNSSYNGGASYASIFKSHNNDTYGSALSCIEEISKRGRISHFTTSIQPDIRPVGQGEVRPLPRRNDDLVHLQYRSRFSHIIRYV